MLIDLLKNIKDVRRYTDKPISKEDLQHITDCGGFTCSEGNEYPFIFGVIDDKAQINELVKCCKGQKWIGTAPVLLAICTRRMSDEEIDLEKFRLGKLKDEVYNMDSNVLDIVCASEHKALKVCEDMTIAALELDIGSCLIQEVDVYKASKVLKIPNSHMVTYLMTLGYGEPVQTEERAGIPEDCVFYNTCEL